jgi:hypothetical protein
MSISLHSNVPYMQKYILNKILTSFCLVQTALLSHHRMKEWYHIWNCLTENVTITFHYFTLFKVQRSAIPVNLSYTNPNKIKFIVNSHVCVKVLVHL